MSGQIIELKPSTIARLELGPKDVVIVRCAENFSPERIELIGRTVKEAVGDHKVLILTPNLSIEVAGPKR